jgi:hypothetical protein
MTGNLYDPINVFCKIALVSLHDPETRIDLGGNVLTIQPRSRDQIWQRSWPFSLNPPSRNDMYRLLYPLKRVLELACSGVEVISYKSMTGTVNQQGAPEVFMLDTASDGDMVTGAGARSTPLQIPAHAALYDSPASSGTSSVAASPLPTASHMSQFTPPVLNHSCTVMSSMLRAPAARGSQAVSPALASTSPSTGSPSDGGASRQQRANHLYRNLYISELLPYYISGLRALQKTYGEGNFESALQLIINIANEAFEAVASGHDVAAVFRKFPPSFENYPRSLIDRTQIIELWEDSTLERIAHVFRSYKGDPLPQNLHRCKQDLDQILETKDQQYLDLIKSGGR